MENKEKFALRDQFINAIKDLLEPLKDLHWLDIDQRISFKVLLIVFKSLNNLAPAALKNVLTIKSHDTMLLQTNYFPETNLGRRAFCFYAPKQWNCLPVSLRCVDEIVSFKSQLKTYLFSNFTSFCQSYNKYDKV